MTDDQHVLVYYRDTFFNVIIVTLITPILSSFTALAFALSITMLYTFRVHKILIMNTMNVVFNLTL